MRKKIRDSLTPLITHDYVLLDLPYYDNIGDTLIWEGTREFLKTLPYKCLYYASKDSFIYRELSSETIILLQGGGNFGDLYRQHSEYRKKIIKLYPNNQIIILPQSVYYENDTYIKEDADAYSNHSNLTICAREQYSYNFLLAHFRNQCLLIPDMAFYIDISKFHLSENQNKILYLKRIDKEFVNENIEYSIPAEAERHDWPTYEQSFKTSACVEWWFYNVSRVCRVIGIGSRWIARLNDWKRNYYYRRFYVQLGIDFLCQYQTVYTTRLHVLILAVLLDKKIYLINNTSGKVVNFYTTWLKEFDNVKQL